MLSLVKLFLAALPSLALASSGADEVDCETPKVEVRNGTYAGVSNEYYQQEYFLGIPYAQPPTGSLRFASPKPVNESFDERSATEYGPVCIGYGADTQNIDAPLSEDCLTLNVVRPAGTQPGDDLPVSIWVHGGSYVMGGSRDVRYNLTRFVEQSVQEGNPIVAVSINYRLSYWGFLYSNEIEDAGAGNIAFRDQRLAFQWINENVDAFGGSSKKVTVWGESAGARSLGMQLIAYDGKHDDLFQGAILESGSPVARFVDADAWQPYFDALVAKTGCSSAEDALGCLRELPWKTLNDVFNGTSSLNVTSPNLSAVLDGDFITAQASELLSQGKFAHVPLLLGNNHDEGTAYGQKGINTTDEFRAYLKGLDLDAQQVDNITSLYPDDPTVGIPPSYTGRPENSPYGHQWKRAAAFAGDYQQHSGRRLLAESYAEAGLDVYSYLWNVYVNGVPPILGATHFQEVAFVFNNTEGVGYPTDPFEDKPETYKQLAGLMSRQWVTFVAQGHPNVDNLTWPKYELPNPDMLVYNVNHTGLTYTAKDDYRKEAIAYLQEFVY